MRVRAAHNRQAHDEQWLLISGRRESEPRHYWFSTRPKQTPVKTLVATAQGRWRIERDYQELKSELGLHHMKGATGVVFTITPVCASPHTGS
ncbi:transposase [Xanthomonas oryzae]|nr:transposase [Xanthomonas oryzae]